MFGQKNTLVIMIKSHELEIFSHDSGHSSTITLPTNVINNLEVLDRDELYALIAAWSKTLTYQISEIIWLLSPSVTFEQVFLEKDKDRWDTLTVNFLDTVPFEEVLSHVYSPVEGRSVIATNQDLINALRHGFSVQGYFTKAVIPANLIGISSPLTAENVKQIMSDMSQIMRENLITPDDESAPSLVDSKGNPKVDTKDAPKPKSQLPLLLGVFGLLVIILVIVIFTVK